MSVAGAVLAGGRGSRMAVLGSKPAVEVAGRPLIAWPLAALAECGCDPVAVVAKPGTVLPVFADGVERWDEEADAFHPVVGLLAALGRASEVLVCAADMPLVDAGVCRALLAAAASAPEALAVVAHAGGRLQPLLAVYREAAKEGLCAALPDGRLVAAVEGLGPVRVEVSARAVFSADTPEAAREAERLLLSP